MRDYQKRYALLWAQAQLKTFTTSELLTRIDKFRTFYVLAWEDALNEGRIEDCGKFYSMIQKITTLFVDLHAETAPADVRLAQTVARYPLMLAPMESIDFAHLIDPEGVNA